VTARALSTSIAARMPTDDSPKPDATPTGVPPRLSRPAAWALALTATLTMAVSYIDRQTLAAIAPDVQRALGFEHNELYYSLLGSAFAVAYLVGAPLAGRIVDVVGARRGLLGAVLVWSAVAGLHAFVPTFGVLFAMRVMLGLAESPSFPAAAQTVQRALPPADRARGFGVLFTGSSIGAAIAPPLATWLAASRFGWRAAFLGTAAAGLLWVPLWLTLAFRPQARAALDRKHVAPPARQMAHPAVLRAMTAVLASAPLLTLIYQWGTKYLVHDHHLTQLETGRLLIFPPLLFDLGAVAFGHLTSRARARGAEGVPRPLLAAAATLMLAGAAIPFAPTPELAVAAVCVTMIGGGGMYALPMADMAVRVPPGLVSAAGGMCAAAQSVAQIVTNFAIGYAVMRTGSYTLILVVLALWVIPGSVIWLAWRAPPPHPSDREDGPEEERPRSARGATA
jgi:ACS family hexuronate transporter-like MFS transporter